MSMWLVACLAKAVLSIRDEMYVIYKWKWRNNLGEESSIKYENEEIEALSCMKWRRKLMKYRRLSHHRKRKWQRREIKPHVLKAVAEENNG